MRSSTLILLAAALACSNSEGSGSAQKAPAKIEPESAAKPSADDDQKAGEKAEEQPAADAVAAAPNDVVLDHEVETIEGETVELSKYRGKALLVVNTASQCGFTPQYAGLQKLYAQYKDQGLEILAFPSNDFGEQEPGTHEEIAQFVDSEFGVEFPMFAKVETKGEGQSPLYKTLTEETGEGIKGEVKWNFTKFLVDPQGKVVARFESPVDPMSDEVRKAVESVLPKPTEG